MAILGLGLFAFAAPAGASAQGDASCADSVAAGDGKRTCAKVATRSPKKKSGIAIVRSSRFAEDYPRRLSVFVRTRSERKLRVSRISLVDDLGETVARGKAKRGRSPVKVVLRVEGDVLQPGTYELKLSTKRDGRPKTRDLKKELSFGSRESNPPGAMYPEPTPLPAPAAGEGMTLQHALVDWRGGQHKGFSQDGFDAPGIGHGVLTCSPTTQWLRFWPNDKSRETTMMNWTFKDWGEWREHAIRENVSTKYTGDDFSEGLNKFGPTPEKKSNGYFVGIITDRGRPEDPGGPSVAPTTLRLTWEWDFTNPDNARCFATATIVREVPDSPVRSLTLNWRKNGNAAGRDHSAATVPGVGEIELSCEKGDGERKLRVIPEPGVTPATFRTFEASEMELFPQDTGPYSLRLPNNGMVTASLGAGAGLIASSRYKVNDDQAAQNFCHLAVQITTG